MERRRAENQKKVGIKIDKNKGKAEKLKEEGREKSRKKKQYRRRST